MDISVNTMTTAIQVVVAATGWRDTWHAGQSAWFEYRCYESVDSADAHLWKRSHSLVTVLSENDEEGVRRELPTLAERAEACMPLTYRVSFPDGHRDDVWEDELLSSPKWFRRPAPSVSGTA